MRWAENKEYKSRKDREREKLLLSLLPQMHLLHSSDRNEMGGNERRSAERRKRWKDQWYEDEKMRWNERGNERERESRGGEMGLLQWLLASKLTPEPSVTECMCVFVDECIQAFWGVSGQSLLTDYVCSCVCVWGGGDQLHVTIWKDSLYFEAVQFRWMTLRLPQHTFP